MHQTKQFKGEPMTKSQIAVKKFNDFFTRLDDLKYIDEQDQRQWTEIFYAMQEAIFEIKLAESKLAADKPDKLCPMCNTNSLEFCKYSHVFACYLCDYSETDDEELIK